MILALKTYVEIDEKLGPEQIRVFAHIAEDFLTRDLLEASHRGGVLKYKFFEKNFNLKILTKDEVSKRFFGKDPSKIKRTEQVQSVVPDHPEHEV
jgi:hypothetical protein